MVTNTSLYFFKFYPQYSTSMKQVLTVLLIFFVFLANGQSFFEFSTLQNRRQHDRYLIDTVIRQSLSQPLGPSTEYKWRSAFWAMELMLYKTPQTQQKLKEAWKKVGQTSEGFQKALLEVSYTLYPTAFNAEARSLLSTTSVPAVFIRCAEYLLLSKQTALFKREIASLLNQKFKQSDFIGFTILKERLLNKSEQNLPPLADIFSKNFLSGQAVIYSLQRTNRDYAGLVIIRKQDGSFIKGKNGKLFHASQLARAITGYPFYITNGNTPQGIFRWTGFDTSSIDYIGPTANLQLVMPVEASPAIFFGDSSYASKQWTKELYASLLPPSWKAYVGVYESFHAGQIGRNEIIMHGTTINPAYYKGQSYFPQTPSLGCLCSYEEWSKTGQRTKSNQQAIVDALDSAGAKKGYVVVINLGDKKTSVGLTEVLSLLQRNGL